MTGQNAAPGVKRRHVLTEHTGRKQRLSEKTERHFCPTADGNSRVSVAQVMQVNVDVCSGEKLRI